MRAVPEPELEIVVEFRRKLRHRRKCSMWSRAWERAAAGLLIGVRRYSATASRKRPSRLKKPPEARPPGLLATSNEFVKMYARSFSMVLAGFKAVAADLIVQKGVEGRKTVDLKRSALFLGFGAVYMGGVQFIFYVDVLGYLFPRAEQFAAQSWAKKLRDKAGMVAVLNQTALEQCVHTPLCFFPAYYIAKEACLGDASKRCDTNVVEVALGEYRKNFFVDMSADACIWCPAHLFNFAFLPMHLRVPFVSCVSFSYLLVLSWFRGAPADATTTAPATAEARQDAAPEARREASLRPQPVGALRPA